MMRTPVHAVAAVTLILMFLSGCVSTQYALLDSRTTQIGTLEVSSNDDRWNLAPGILTQHLPDGSSLWTRDGLLLDQLMLLGPIAHEQTLFVSNNPDTLTFPTFRKEMLPNEIEELIQATLSRQLGAGAVVTTSNLRPQRLGSERALAFDALIEFNEGATQKGYVTALIVDQALYVIMYQGAQLYYFDKHWEAANAVIESVRVVGDNVATSGR